MDDDFEDVANDPFKMKGAMLVSVLAMVLAVCSLGGSNAAKDAAFYNIQASNMYSFFQAKNVRQTQYKVAIEEIDLQLQMKSIPADYRSILEAKKEAFKKTVERYETEPSTNEGKKELMGKAKEYEALRDVAMERDPWFDYAEAFLNIAMVLTSIALITSRMLFFYMACGLGTLGTLSGINGFLLLVHL